MKDKAASEIILTIPILQDIELVATRVVDTLTEIMNFDKEKRSEVAMALLETCINSFEHSKSPDHQVNIRFLMFSDRLRIVVSDSGVGFEVNSIEVPSIENKLHPGIRKRGWGITLMKKLMDSVSIESSPSGTVITMEKMK
jgi:serine/threonine-protein kinase RsbW